jgi:hypothetical protein
MSKTKTKIAKPKTRARRSKVSRVEREHWMARNYPAKYMMIAVAIVLALNLLAFNPFTQSELNAGLSLLNMEPLVQEVSMDIAEVFQPTIDFVYAINDFYALSADALTYLLSGDDPSILIAVYAINDFYASASDEMIVVLDLSGSSRIYEAQVAGAVIEIK